MTLTVNYDKVKSQNESRYKNSPFFLFFVKDNEKSLGIFTPCQGANIPKDFLLSLLLSNVGKSQSQYLLISKGKMHLIGSFPADLKANMTLNFLLK